MTAGEFDQLVDALPPQAQAQVRGAQKRLFAEQLVRVKVLYAEARKQKLDETPRVQRQLELQKENLLASLLMQEMTANAQVDDATARQYYDQHKSDYETARARHILIRAKGSPLPVQPGKKELTDEEALAKAQEIHKRLLAGEDFAALAKAESDDVRSGANGGDLGPQKHNQTVPPFDQAVFSLPVGEISEPVKTQFGYHIIKVEQRELKPFDEAKPEIEKSSAPNWRAVPWIIFRRRPPLFWMTASLARHPRRQHPRHQRPRRNKLRLPGAATVGEKKDCWIPVV